MRSARFVFLLIAILIYPIQAAIGTSKRKIPCKIPANAISCYWTHGRLIAGNGTPSFRLWKVGTHRVLGIYSGPSVDRYNSLDNEDPALPTNLDKYNFPEDTVFADFEVCPLEPEKTRHMLAACIESAKNIVVKK